jgi:hypothetical protein
MAETGPRAAVWIAAAILHRDHPEREAFEVGEIQERAGEEGLVDRPERLEVHATVQCVANMRPNPGTERYLYATRDGGRRLFRPGDDFHPERAEGPTTPDVDELPEAHRPLLDWYDEEWDETDEVEVPEEVGAYGYKVLRAGSAKEAEAALGRLGADGWRLREAVPVASEGPGDDVWLVLERET